MTAPFVPPVMSDVVVDESHWNSTPNLALAKAAGIAAIIFKATQGTGFVDPTFASRVAMAQEAGLLVGAYHFLDGSDPVAQMRHFLGVTAGTKAPLLLALDFEPNPSSQAMPIQAGGAASTVHSKTGVWPVIYTGRWMLSAPNAILAECPLWLAEYGSAPICPPGWSQWKLWQHTASATVSGIGVCDRNRFAGSVADLDAWWHAQTTRRA